MLNLLFLALFIGVISPPAFAGVQSTPELDPTTLSSIAATLTGGYLAYRMYSLKAKNK